MNENDIFLYFDKFYSLYRVGHDDVGACICGDYRSLSLYADYIPNFAYHEPHALFPELNRL